MQQNARFIRKLPIPMDIKKEFPITEQITEAREKRVAEMRAILDGRDKRLMLVIGPCSADREDSVMDYICRLVPLQEQVKDKILIVPRIYTNKPRTDGAEGGAYRKIDAAGNDGKAHAQGDYAHYAHAEENDFHHGKRGRFRLRRGGLYSLCSGSRRLKFRCRLDFNSGSRGRSGQGGLRISCRCRHGPLLGGCAPRHQGERPEYSC